MKNDKRRIFLIPALMILVILFGLAGYVEIKSSSAVPILMYHSITHNDDAASPSVSPEMFERHMEFLFENSYNVVGPDEAVAFIKKEKPMPPKTVVITADDGYADFYKYAFPVLRRHNLKAALFIATDHVGKEGYLSWRELREMSDSGLVTIGSHTRSHPWLPTTSLDTDKLNDEISGSKDILERELGKKTDFLCYPNGGFNDLVKEAAKEAGYKGAFTTNPSRYSAMDDIYAIRRLKMSRSSDSPLILWGKINRYYAWFKERR